MEILNGAKDLSTPFDYQFEELFGSEGAILPAKFELNFTEIQDQSIKREPSTGYACTNFSASHATNIMNFIEGSNILVKGEDLWKIALTRGATIDGGWFVKSAVDLIKELGYIDGYSVVKGELQMKQSLYKNQLICTGSNKIVWQKTLDNNFLGVLGESYGHAFVCQGWDDNLHGGVFIFRNSYGPNRWDKGRFYIKYSDVGALFTCFALVDHANTELLQSYQQKKMDENVQKAIDLGITSGARPNDNITRKEVFAMLGALSKLIEVKTGSLK